MISCSAPALFLAEPLVHLPLALDRVPHPPPPLSVIHPTYCHLSVLPLLVPRSSPTPSAPLSALPNPFLHFIAADIQNPVDLEWDPPKFRPLQRHLLALLDSNPCTSHVEVVGCLGGQEDIRSEK